MNGIMTGKPDYKYYAGLKIIEDPSMTTVKAGNKIRRTFIEFILRKAARVEIITEPSRQIIQDVRNKALIMHPAMAREILKQIPADLSNE